VFGRIETHGVPNTCPMKVFMKRSAFAVVAVLAVGTLSGCSGTSNKENGEVGAVNSVSDKSAPPTEKEVKKPIQQRTPGVLTATIVDQHGQPFSGSGNIGGDNYLVVDALGEIASKIKKTAGGDGTSVQISTVKPLVPGTYKLLLPSVGEGSGKKLAWSWDCRCYPVSKEFTMPSDGLDLGEIAITRFAKVTIDGVFNEVGTELEGGSYKYIDVQISDQVIAKESPNFLDRYRSGDPFKGTLPHNTVGFGGKLPSGTYTIEVYDGTHDGLKEYLAKRITFEIKNNEDINLGKIVLQKK